MTRFRRIPRVTVGGQYAPTLVVTVDCGNVPLRLRSRFHQRDRRGLHTRPIRRRLCSRAVAQRIRAFADVQAVVDDVESRPGIVYIEQAVTLSRAMDGALLHTIAGSREMPLLRVLLKTNLAPDYAIAAPCARIAARCRGPARGITEGRRRDNRALCSPRSRNRRLEIRDGRSAGHRVARARRAAGGPPAATTQWDLEPDSEFRDSDPGIRPPFGSAFARR